MVDSVGKPIAAPGSFVPEHVIAFDAGGGRAATVDRANPLPIAAIIGAALSTPLQGVASVSTTAGPFIPELGRPIVLALSGSWTGSAMLLRSTDGGVTRLPLTMAGQPWGVFSANAQEAVGEETAADASWYLAVTLSTGTLSYRIAQ